MALLTVPGYFSSVEQLAIMPQVGAVVDFVKWTWINLILLSSVSITASSDFSDYIGECKTATGSEFREDGYISTLCDLLLYDLETGSLTSAEDRLKIQLKYEPHFVRYEEQRRILIDQEEIGICSGALPRRRRRRKKRQIPSENATTTTMEESILGTPFDFVAELTTQFSFSDIIFILDRASLQGTYILPRENLCAHKIKLKES